MKKIIQLFTILTLLLVVTTADLVAREVSGSLSAGEGSSFAPSQGSAFSIISDIKSGVYDGKFDILIRSGGRVIYKENNQIDDLYLVFNEPINDSDVIKLDVVKGVFLFKMSKMETLPDVIVDAIKKQAPRSYKQLKRLHKRKKRKIPVKKEEPRVIKRHIQPKEYVEKPTKKPISKEPGFFDKLSNNIGKFTSSKDKTPDSVSPIEVPKDISKPIANDDIKKPIISNGGVDGVSTSIDSINKEIATVIKSQSRKINENVTNGGIEQVAKTSKVNAPTIATSGIESFPMAETFPLDFKRPKPPVGIKCNIPKNDAKVETFSKVTQPTMQKAQTGVFQTMVGTSAEPKPKFSSNIAEPVLEEVFEVKPSVVEPAVVKTVSEPVIVKAPVIKEEPVKNRIIITKTLIPEKKKEAKKEESRVIKRHIEPKEYKRDHESELEPMSDRVAGNGYGMGSKGKIKIKAYSNNRPISAWVEVFKADTKQRVKTFYTGQGSSLKDIKLPAGTYVIKATYRTATSKRKKTIGKVVLQEGESIHRKISFDDGVVTVKVKKSGKPFYAKVEVYKSGSKRRIAYDFSSKSTGIVKLSLGSGKYDIVIKDHSKVKRFNSVSVKGGKSKTLYANF